MSAGNVFSLRRFRLLLRRDFYTQYKTFLTGLGAIFGILVIVNVASAPSANQWNFNQVFYPLTLFIGGCIFTSMCFGELANAHTRIPYLTLPASALEKFVSKLLISGIGYVCVSLILYVLFSVFTFLITSWLFHHAHAVFNPLDTLVVFLIGIYLVTHSVFLLGAVYFRGNAFLKTVLSLFIIALLYSAFVWLTGAVTYFALALNTRVFFNPGMFNGEIYKQFTAGGIFLVIIQVIFWVIMAPLFWVIAFFRLKESEV